MYFATNTLRPVRHDVHDVSLTVAQAVRDWRGDAATAFQGRVEEIQSDLDLAVRQLDEAMNLVSAHERSLLDVALHPELNVQVAV